MTEQASAHGRTAVAVAIVISRLGILIGRRRDGQPPWSFPGGKIAPGESPEDAAVRETLEETGLHVRATAVIGSRVHPATGVLMVYVAAELADEAGVMVNASDELTEVRWVSAAEAADLMDEMFPAVRQYLAG